MMTMYKFGKVQQCRSFGKRYLKIKMEPVLYQLSRCDTNSLPISLHFRGKVMPEVQLCIQIIFKTMHSTCCWHLILSDSEEYGEIS